MDYMNYVVIVLVLLITGAAFCFWYFSYRRRHWRLGNGIVFARNPDDGTVWVASRLVDSPSGRAGVQNCSRVLLCNGQTLIFASDEHFLAWHASVKGTIAVWTFVGGPSTVVLVPELIKQETIPSYWEPGEAFQKDSEQRDRNPVLKKGRKLCEETGQYVPLYSLSESAIQSVSR